MSGFLYVKQLGLYARFGVFLLSFSCNFTTPTLSLQFFLSQKTQNGQNNKTPTLRSGKSSNVRLFKLSTSD
ncbi:unnamed protein product [Meloidogyne enterolobii]|uniref:Uncharacterized protein n=1 Tax=Meloidogyne enterolobii TaxID=390850 RepID=A0ACB0YMX7_MELEN